MEGLDENFLLLVGSTHVVTELFLHSWVGAMKRGAEILEDLTEGTNLLRGARRIREWEDQGVLASGKT